MNARSHATSRILPINLRLQYTPGLQGFPPTILIGTRAPMSGGLAAVRFWTFRLSPTHSFDASFALGTGSIELTGGIVITSFLYSSSLYLAGIPITCPQNLWKTLPCFGFVLMSVHICSIGQCLMTISLSSTFFFI